MTAEEPPDYRPLRTCSAPVDDAHLGKSPRRGLLEVLHNNRGDVLRGERVQVQAVLDGDLHGVRPWLGGRPRPGIPTSARADPRASPHRRPPPGRPHTPAGLPPTGSWHGPPGSTRT